MDVQAPVVRWTRPPSYERFFHELDAVLEPTDRERVNFAYVCSKAGHEGQTRIDGSRYFDHPKAAAWFYMHELQGRDPEVIIRCLLHDMREDSWLLSPYRIRLNFGEEVALDVSAMTKLRTTHEPIEEYLDRIVRRGVMTIIAKLCDRLHNIRTLHACTPQMREEQLTETKRYHMPILLPALRNYGGVYAVIAQRIEDALIDAMASYEGR